MHLVFERLALTMSSQSRYQTIPPTDDDSGRDDANVDQPLLSSQTPSGVNRISGLPDKGSFTVHSDGSIAYAYGPGGLRGLKHNYYALACALFASIGGLEFGYDQGVVCLLEVLPWL
jgi:hypothetical protein